MIVRASQYLYLRAPLPVRVADVPVGRTVTAEICEIQTGDPEALGELSRTLMLPDAHEHVADFLPEALLAHIPKRFYRQPVYLHLDDVEHDVWRFIVTDVDPDLLEPPS